MGRVARLGSGSGSCGIGGDGRAGAGCGARSDRYGSPVSKSGEMRAEAEAEGGLEDRPDWASVWRTSGESCACGLVGEMLAAAGAEGCWFRSIRVDFAGVWGASLGIDGLLGRGVVREVGARDLSLIFSLDDDWPVGGMSV